MEKAQHADIFPQIGGESRATHDSVEKSPPIRGIRDGFRQTPRILLVRAGDGDHLRTTESRSMWAVLRINLQRKRATILSNYTQELQPR